MSKPYIAAATAQPVRESTLDPPNNDRPTSHKRLRVDTPPADEESWPAVIRQPAGRIGDTSMVQAATQTEAEASEFRRTVDTSDGITNGGNGSPSAPAPSRGTLAREITPDLLTTIRNSISEQFDIEIVLKHRELRIIESEMAKTQACIEQLRRCTLIPYPGPETQLEQKPTYSGFPDYHPPPPGAVDGPYTRHYRQWLLHDKKFGDAESSYAGSRRYSGNDQFTNTGRPQRQSAIKAQPNRVEGQGLLFRRRDGQLVRMVCINCKRSNFSSAQGFINHCRIAHSNEYASHDLAAEACGEPVDESALNLAPPVSVPPIDGPARNTRNTYNQLPPSPQESSYTHTRRSSAMSNVSPNLPLHTPRPTRPHQRKASRQAAMITPKTNQDPQGTKPPTPPTERGSFSTTHLESLMKSKNFDVDVDEVMKSVTSGFEDMAGFSDSELGTEDERGSSANPESHQPLQTPDSMGSTPTNGIGNRSAAFPLQESSRTPSSGFTGFLPPPHSRRAGLIGHRTVPSSLDIKKEEKDGDDDVLMGDGYDAGFSSSDEGGYDSDAGGDDDLYDPPPPRNGLEDGSTTTTTVPTFPGTINPSMLHLTGASSPIQPPSP